jgi:hypothetical protein
MKEAIMSWQIAQIFLSETGVHEVQINADSKKLRCDCAGYGSRSVCKHMRYVRKRIEENDGIYPVEVSSRASQAESSVASLDPELFRAFLFKYGKIEVI